VVADGPSAYFATLPIKNIVNALHQNGIPAKVSNTAGTFVYNHLMYGVLYYLDKRPVIKAGFIHVPYIPEQVKNKKEMPALELSEIVRGLEAAITAIAINGTDKKLAYGQND
ncbi:MAG: pyroglutamyl-peptidase I, partial [Oribacterium parvum]|nr:pyroglutamyl-peptidase I [Oribacterium parvum]